MLVRVRPEKREVVNPIAGVGDGGWGCVVGWVCGWMLGGVCRCGECGGVKGVQYRWISIPSNSVGLRFLR